MIFRIPVSVMAMTELKTVSMSFTISFAIASRTRATKSCWCCDQNPPEDKCLFAKPAWCSIWTLHSQQVEYVHVNMETFSTSRIHRGNGKPVIWTFDVIFVVRLNKLMKKTVELPMIWDALTHTWRHHCNTFIYFSINYHKQIWFTDWCQWHPLYMKEDIANSVSLWLWPTLIISAIMLEQYWKTKMQFYFPDDIYLSYLRLNTFWNSSPHREIFVWGTYAA